MTPSPPPDDLASRIRRLPAHRQRQALAYLVALEQTSADPAVLLGFAGRIPADDLAVMASAIASACEGVDATEW